MTDILLALIAALLLWERIGNSVLLAGLRNDLSRWLRRMVNR